MNFSKRPGSRPASSTSSQDSATKWGSLSITHRDVAKVAFTGGDKTGQAVYEQAARGIKRVTLELGGKSANIVFDDADLDQAVNGVVSGIFAATGQTCIAGSRALIHRPVYDAFVERLIALARSARMGNPLELTTQVGPITTQPQYRKVLDYMDVAKDEGAVCLLGGGACNAARVRHGLVCRTDDICRRQIRHAHCQRRSVRAIACSNSVRR